MEIIRHDLERMADDPHPDDDRDALIAEYEALEDVPLW